LLYAGTYLSPLPLISQPVGDAPHAPPPPPPPPPGVDRPPHAPPPTPRPPPPPRRPPPARRRPPSPPPPRPPPARPSPTRTPARRLDADVDLALGDAVALRDDLEVVDQRLHGGVQLLARREHDLAVVRDPRLPVHPIEPVQALLDDPHRLAHLVDAHAVAVIDV